MSSNPRQPAISPTLVISRAAQLSGTGRIADDLYLLAHHECTGRPHLQSRAVGLGLAGALLAELVLPGAIRVWRGLVIPGGGRPPADALTPMILSAVAAEREHLPARDWLLFLARTAAEDVASRLGEAGYLTRARTAGWWPGRTPRWVPADPDSAFAPLVRVKAAVDARGPVPVQHVLLGRLATACGLSHQMSLYLPPAARLHLEEAARYLDPDLRALVAATQTAVESALLAHRM